MAIEWWGEVGGTGEGGLQPLTEELARPDDAAAPAHLIIGLGGIGRRTIAELRRTLDRPYGSRPLRSIPVHYLAIDLDDALQAPADVPSSLLHGDGGPLFALDMASVRAFSSHLPDEVRQWLSRYDAATEIGSDTAANPRRLGSLLLAAKAGQLQDWLTEHASDLLRTSRELQVHVVGYLAGGIGGGALTQLLVQLRRNQVMSGRCHILVYGLLPASGESLSDDGEPAAVNTGALLTELASAQHRRPARADGADGNDLGIQRLCDEVLVISPPAETGRMARDVRTLPEALAMTVRQRLAVGPRAEAARAGEGARQPIVAAAPIVLSTASDEIEEALSIALLQSALYQQIYANWRHGRGFVGEVGDEDWGDYVRRVEIQDGWLISAEHLIQSAPVLDADAGDGRWKLLAEDWKDCSEAFLERALGQPRKQWLDAITRLWNEFYETGFRGAGVAAFYRARQGLRRDMARTIRRKVEQQLFDDWQRGERGLVGSLSVLDALIELQRERLASVDERVANTRLAEESCRLRVAAAVQKWARLPSWGWGRGEAETLLHAYSINLQEMYVNKTRAEGWLFAKTVLPVIVEELESLRQLIGRLAGHVQRGAHGVDMLLDGLSARMEEAEFSQNFVLHLFDRAKLQQFARDILVGERAQLAHCQNARNALAKAGAATGDFSAVVGWVEKNDWLREVAALCRDQIVGEGGIWTAAVRAILDASIYDVLQARAEGDFGKLRDIASLLISQALLLLPATTQRELSTRLYVLLPRDPQRATFVKTLQSAFSFSKRNDIAFLETEEDGGTLYLLTVTAPFSIPDIELLRQMDRTYRNYVERDREYAMLSLHAVGGSGDQQAEFALEEGRPGSLTAALLLISLPLKLVVERVSDDGRASLWLIPKDEHGFEDAPIAIADDLLTAPQDIDPTLASLLDDNVTRALAAMQGDCEKLIGAVVEKVVQVRARCNDDPFDPVYRSFVEAGKMAATVVRSRWGKEPQGE